MKIVSTLIHYEEIITTGPYCSAEGKQKKMGIFNPMELYVETYCGVKFVCVKKKRMEQKVETYYGVKFDCE